MIKRGWIIAVVLALLTVPVWPGQATGPNRRSSRAGAAGICDLAPCIVSQIADRVKCMMPPPPGCQGCRTPGFALAILKDDKVFYEATSGFANLDTRQPVTRNTVFDLASLTKQFTAAGIMMLIEDPNVKVKGRRVTVDTPLSDLFDNFPPQFNEILIADLLTHQSGLPDYIQIYQAQRPGFKFESSVSEGSPSWYETMNHRFPNEELKNEQVLEMLRRAEPQQGVKPGTDFIYSNSGYVVLAQIIEKLSGKTYKQFMQERIFNPLGMRNTTVFDETSGKIPNHAFPYGLRAGRYFALEGYTPLNFVHGDGNIHSTLADMIKWMKAIDNIEHGRRPSLLKRETLMQAFTSTRLRENMSKPLRYGFGWYVARKNTETGGPTVRVIYHAGDWPGFHSYMLDGHIEQGGKTACELTAIVLSNFEPEKTNSKPDTVVGPSTINRPCYLARELSKLFWGENQDRNIILDDFKMWCGSDPNPTCGPVPKCNQGGR